MTTASPVAGGERLAAKTILNASRITVALQRMTGALMSNYLRVHAAPSVQKTIRMKLASSADDGSTAGEHVQARTLVYSLKVSTSSETKIYIHFGKSSGTGVLRDEFVSRYLDSMAIQGGAGAGARVMQAEALTGLHLTAAQRGVPLRQTIRRRRHRHGRTPTRVAERAVLPPDVSPTLVLSPPDARREERVADTLDPQSALRHELQADFVAEPVEGGMDHEAENTLARVLASDHGEDALEWIREFCTDAKRPAFAASVLNCLGNLELPGSAEWRVTLVRDALATDNTQVKDAAVQAVEKWGEPGLVDVLRTHQENVQWLHEYILGVIDDLGG